MPLATLKTLLEQATSAFRSHTKTSPPSLTATQALENIDNLWREIEGAVFVFNRFVPDMIRTSEKNPVRLTGILEGATYTKNGIEVLENGVTTPAKPIVDKFRTSLKSSGEQPLTEQEVEAYETLMAQLHDFNNSTNFDIKTLNEYPQLKRGGLDKNT